MMNSVHVTRVRVLEHVPLFPTDGEEVCCAICGYDLRGAPEPRCAECGTPVDMSDAPQPDDLAGIRRCWLRLSPAFRREAILSIVVFLLALAVTLLKVPRNLAY
jgi:hypothetical protein